MIKNDWSYTWAELLVRVDLPDVEPNFVTCPHCYEEYWSEDGHPEGTLCPVFGIDAKKHAQEELPGDKGFLVCNKHKARFWFEDKCRECWEEIETQ